MTAKDEKKILSAGLRSIREHGDVREFVNNLVEAVGSQEHLVALMRLSLYHGTPQQRMSSIQTIVSMLQYSEDAERGVAKALQVEQ